MFASSMVSVFLGAGAPAATDVERPIVHLVSANGTRITAVAGADEPRYFASDAAGVRTTRSATLEELRTGNRGVYNRLHGYAEDESDVEAVEPIVYAGL